MTHQSNFRYRHALWGVLLASCFGLTGCMGEYNGQNLPTPYYMSSQIQYYPAGPEFKLTREAAAQKEYRETEAQRVGVVPAPGILGAPGVVPGPAVVPVPGVVPVPPQAVPQ
jgi:hypothetical protein